MESENVGEIKDAINYLYTCSISTHDDEVASLLKETIDINKSVTKEIETKQIKSKPVDTSNRQDYFSAHNPENVQKQSASFWISGMKIFSWILFISIIIAGIVLAGQEGRHNEGVGAAILLASVVVAFLSVAVMMIFLNMARDLSEINTILRNLKK